MHLVFNSSHLICRFSSVVDMLEDIMQASVPTFCHSVRIADVGLGRNAARITAIRSLPDAKTRASNKTRAQSGETAPLNSDENDEDSSDPTNDQEDALNGDHVNVEVSFAYRGLPSGQSVASKAGNVHLLVEFFVGIRGVYGVRVREYFVALWSTFVILIELHSCLGRGHWCSGHSSCSVATYPQSTIVSSSPSSTLIFCSVVHTHSVKMTMVSLMGLPRITISVVPLAKFLPNVMDLPFVSGFISSAIDTAVAEYVAPKSLTLDLQQLISGDDIKKGASFVLS